MTSRVLNEGGDSHEDEDRLFGWEEHGFTRNHEIVLAEYLLLFITILCIALVVQFYVGKVWKWHYLPESGATVLLGMLIGGIIRSSGGDTAKGDRGETLLGFNTTIFFVGFLPPIIFNSGYQINRRLFFKNMGGIVCLAVLGTALGTAVIGVGLWALGEAGVCYKLTPIETVTFGSLISATDPVSTLAVFSELKVHPTLFYLVFGESVLNDAVAITLFKTTSEYIGREITYEDGLIAFADFIIKCAGSILIGYGLGVLFAWVFKVVDLSKHRLLLVSLFVGMVYIPFLLSETLQLSGILTILFSAITARRYINHNIPPEAQRASAFVFELMAYLCETGVFLYLGFDVFSTNVTGGYRLSLMLWTLLLCLVSRALYVYPFLTLINSYRKKVAKEKGSSDANLIPMSTIHMVFFSGLRGAVAYATANIYPDTTDHRKEIVATTTTVILVTLFICGGLTVQMCEWLGIETGVDVTAITQKMHKIETSAFLIWEHKYVYPMVIKGYNDPNFTDPYKPKTDEIDDDLGGTLHVSRHKKKSSVRAVESLSEGDEEQDDLDELDVTAARAAYMHSHEPAPWRYNQLDTDIIEAPRSFSLPALNMEMLTKLNNA